MLLLKSPSPQLLSYDTTFQLGDFYVSVLSFRHTLFKEAPVMPAAFLLHERKFQPHHEEFIGTCTKLVRSLTKSTHPIITDEERGIVNAITSNLPTATRLRCWNHVFQDVTRWLRSHGAKSEEVSIYLTDVRDLFHQSSEVEYKEMLEKVTQKWSAPFREYYTNEIAPDITSIARWVIEPYGIYDPYSGITNNQAEGLNFVLKQLQDWREAPVDCMALALHHLQSYYLVEIARGQHDMGNYHLHPQYQQLQNCTPVPNSAFSPDEIVSRIKGTLSAQPGHTPEVRVPTSTHDSPTQFSQMERARLIVEQNRINLDTKLHTFTVLGSERPHVVTLFPRETCSCQSTTTCYHILAAKMSVGVDQQQQSKHRVNLTQLRRNARSRREKKSGRKCPRPGDCDIVPAPDSSAAMDTNPPSKTGYYSLVPRPPPRF